MAHPPRRVLVVSSQRLFRDGLCSLLNGHTEIAVSAPEVDGAPMAIMDDLARWQPDVVILDAKDLPAGQADSTQWLSPTTPKVIVVALDATRLTAYSEQVIENARAEDLLSIVQS